MVCLIKVFYQIYFQCQKAHQCYCNARSTYNQNILHLAADVEDSEFSTTAVAVDILSNGFKCRGTNAVINSSGANYIYAAFAEAPLVNSEKVPGTAR